MKFERLSNAYSTYRGKVHGIRVTEDIPYTFHTHVPQNIASSGYPEYNLPEGTVAESKARMWANACRDDNEMQPIDLAVDDTKQYISKEKDEGPVKRLKPIRR